MSGGEGVSSQTSYEGISDLLKCYICFDRLKGAVMCPHCSKMSCYHCIEKWMSTGKPECPHCRTRLKESDLIKVPSVQDLCDFIGSKQPLATDKEFCSSHPQMALTVYCETCGICICSDCALWGEHRENQGHCIKPVEELYKQQRKLLEKKLSKLQDRLKEILSLVEHMEITMEGTKSQRNKMQQEIDKVVEDIYSRLNDQLRKKLQGLTNDKRYLKRQACQITTISTEIEGKIRGSQSVIVSQKDELQERLTNALKELEGSRISELEKRPDMGTFDNEIVPPYETAFFEIKDFTKKRQAGVEIFSNQLTFCGLSWRLKVYPNGTEDFIGRHLGVFVELYDGYSQTAMYNYFVEIVYGAGHYKSTRPRSGNFKRDYGSDFAVGEAWGYKKFFEIRNLEPKGFLVKDTVLLKFGVRHPTFHQKCRDSFLYINDLKHKIMALKHENSQLKRKCEGIADDSDDTALLKTKNKSRKAKSPRDIQEQSLEEMTTTAAVNNKEKEKRKTESTKEEQQLEEPSTRAVFPTPEEDLLLDSDRLMSSSGSSIGGNHQQQQLQHKLSKTVMSLSQPHLYSMHDSRMQRLDKTDSSRRSSAGLHPNHTVLVPGQRTRHQQQHQQSQQAGMNYGHCIPHRRISDDSSQVLMEQQRQTQQSSYNSPQSRMHQQQMMYDQSQSMIMAAGQHPIYPTSLSQADYSMMMMSHPHRGGGAGMTGDYFMTIRENPEQQQQQQEWMMPAQSQPTGNSTTMSRKPSKKDFESSQSDITNFMEDPGSPGTLNGDFNSSQLVPPFYSAALSQELDMELSDIPSVNTPIDDSQKVGYGSMVDMTQQQQTSGEYIMRRKSNELPSTPQMHHGNMDPSQQGHMSRSIHNMPSDNSRRKPVTRAQSISHGHGGQHGTSSHTNMKKMGSEPQLNKFGPPGLLSTILPRINPPTEMIRPSSSSTLPRNHGRSNKHTNTTTSQTTPNGGRQTSPTRHQVHGQRFKQAQAQKMAGSGGNRGGVVSLTQPNPPPLTGEERKSVSMTQRTEHETPPPTPSMTTSVTAPSPVHEQSPASNQKLRGSKRSYRMTKKCHEGRQSPSKSALTNSFKPTTTANTLELTFDVKTPPNDSNTASFTSDRLTVGGNITNNSSLSQLDKLL